MVLLNAGTVQTGIHVDENAHAAAFPPSGLRRIFSQDGDLGFRVFGCELPDADGVGSNHRVREKNILNSGRAGGSKLNRSGTFGLTDPLSHQPTHDEL